MDVRFGLPPIYIKLLAWMSYTVMSDGKEMDVIPQLAIEIVPDFFNAGNVSKGIVGALLMLSIYFMVSNSGSEMELNWVTAKSSTFFNTGKESVPIPEMVNAFVVPDSTVCNAGKLMLLSEPEDALILRIAGF